MSATQPVRRRDAGATREAILASARLAFIRSGYDGAGVREIAEGAGVTAMLVNRYFGSKERLFADVVAETMAAPGILTGEVTSQNRDLMTFGRDLATALVAKTMPEVAPLDGFLIMLRSTSNERATAIWREQIEQHYQKALVALAPGALAAERAALLLALIMGFQVMRQVVGVSALVEADPAALSGLLACIFQSLVHSDHR